MSYFQLGYIIKTRREELGYSQADLADGICAVTTLSRIENGDRMPSRSHYEILMQRLGYSSVSLDFFTDKQEFLVYEKKFQIRQLYVAQDYSTAKEQVAQLITMLPDPTPIDRQFILLYETLLNKKQYTPKEELSRYEEAFRITQPKYVSNGTFKVLSYEEIILLNNIAQAYAKLGDENKAINIWYSIKAYYDRHVISTEEALRTQPMILYNLSNHLGLSERYDECIEVCHLGIRLARATGRCVRLGRMLFNLGWALVHRNLPGDKETAKQHLVHAYQFTIIMGKPKEAKILEEFFTETYGCSIPNIVITENT